MNTIQNRIDQSVKFTTEKSPAKGSKKYAPISLAAKAEHLKSALAQRLSAEYADVESRLVWQAVNEAHALAATTFAPLLVLPDLAEEKVQQVAAWSNHQRSVRRGEFLAHAA
jgi:hypothetical protein